MGRANLQFFCERRILQTLSFEALWFCKVKSKTQKVPSLIPLLAAFIFHTARKIEIVDVDESLWIKTTTEFYNYYKSFDAPK